jgi:hypothetical protein
MDLPTVTLAKPIDSFGVRLATPWIGVLHNQKLTAFVVAVHIEFGFVRTVCILVQYIPFDEQASQIFYAVRKISSMCMINLKGIQCPIAWSKRVSENKVPEGKCTFRFEQDVTYSSYRKIQVRVRWDESIQ